MPRKLFFPLFLAASLGSACSNPAATPVELALTHQWSTRPGTSLFVQISLGAAPEGAADPLMSLLPTLVHQLGERCRNDPAAATPGAFSLSFTLREGLVSAPHADPTSALAHCVLDALPALVADNRAAWAEYSPAALVLHLEHAPLS